MENVCIIKCITMVLISEYPQWETLNSVNPYSLNNYSMAIMAKTSWGYVEYMHRSCFVILPWARHQMSVFVQRFGGEPALNNILDSDEPLSELL